ncbi:MULTISPECIES: SCO family protein [unclassified Bordetella]|uniref:SCO family protein n=1 Tax=unclassified Bordetella TaxID=2630031 RepID=UPI001326552F|nr:MULTISPECIES: SCO family protein [unclassified Bordetella]MVW72619.1 redoxin domain-containing protein [Bordetella sp. 15P40C-2]MVW78459.1 redoxin domain-containing protein [Bordetella sp. 02P26C-1]
MSVFSALRRTLLRGAALMLAAGVLAGCSEPEAKFQGSDITGTHLGRAMALTDQNGEKRTIEGLAGKVVVVFFGFTQCPDVCPTALAELSQVMQKLGPDADRVQVLMVTVDPERDTPEILKQYVTSFDPRFLGLTGTPAEIRAAAASFKAYYAKIPTEGDNYTMDHTAAFYLFDPKGESRVLLGNSLGADAMAHDIKLLLDSK